MTNRAKRVKRFGLLTQLQKTNVEHAAQRYRACIQAHEQALVKLKGLEDYFANGPPQTEDRNVYAGALREASVFAARLHTAISAQQTVCEQLAAQAEAARQLLMNAEQRRVGLDKARLSAQRQLEQSKAQMEQRRTEDTLMARYSRSA